MKDNLFKDGGIPAKGLMVLMGKGKSEFKKISDWEKRSMADPDKIIIKNTPQHQLEKLYKESGNE